MTAPRPTRRDQLVAEQGERLAQAQVQLREKRKAAREALDVRDEELARLEHLIAQGSA